eukprot:4884208-Prymnesium_polylepis.2
MALKATPRFGLLAAGRTSPAPASNAASFTSNGREQPRENEGGLSRPRSRKPGSRGNGSSDAGA